MSSTQVELLRKRHDLQNLCKKSIHIKLNLFSHREEIKLQPDIKKNTTNNKDHRIINSEGDGITTQIGTST